MKIPERVILPFDLSGGVNQERKEVFANDVARTIFLAVKTCFQTGGGFDQKCLACARDIGKDSSISQVVEALKQHVLLPHSYTGEELMAFSEQLLPFLRKEKVISYE